MQLLTSLKAQCQWKAPGDLPLTMHWTDLSSLLLPVCLTLTTPREIDYFKATLLLFLSRHIAVLPEHVRQEGKLLFHFSLSLARSPQSVLCVGHPHAWPRQGGAGQDRTLTAESLGLAEERVRILLRLRPLLALLPRLRARLLRLLRGAAPLLGDQQLLLACPLQPQPTA